MSDRREAMSDKRYAIGDRRVLACVSAVAFAVTLAVLVGQRLSDQAVAVLTGAVCGVSASIPTSLLVVWVTRKRQEQPPAYQQPANPGFYPPVIVVQPPQNAAPSNPYQPAGYLPPYAAPSPREFTVVGGEAEEVIYGRRQ